MDGYYECLEEVMVRVSYVKEFLSGNLTGLSVPCSFRTVDYQHGLRYLRDLQLLTKDNPGSDCVTGSMFFVKRLELADV